MPRRLCRALRPTMKRAAALCAALLALAAAPAVAKADPGQASGYDRTGDAGTVADISAVAATWGDEGWLVFSAAITRSVLFTGEQLGAVIDVNGGGGDYMLTLQQYGDGATAAWLTLWVPAWQGWNLDVPQQTVGGRFANGVAQIWVHRSELSWVTTGVNFQMFSTSNGYAATWDWAPDGVWWHLPQATEVGGARGPGADDEPPVTSKPTLPPAASDPPPAGQQLGVINARKAAKALRKLLARTLGRARITYRRCKTSGSVMTCKIRAQREQTRYRGTATITALASGRHTARFRGVRFNVRCGPRCAKPIS
jgi:hypothetical protein